MLVYFMAIWNILYPFGIHILWPFGNLIWYIFPVLVSCLTKNLATLFGNAAMGRKNGFQTEDLCNRLSGVPFFLEKSLLLFEETQKLEFSKSQVNQLEQVRNECIVDG
jgi:hypothetical protein